MLMLYNLLYELSPVYYLQYISKYLIQILFLFFWGNYMFTSNTFQNILLPSLVCLPSIYIGQFFALAIGIILELSHLLRIL